MPETTELAEKLKFEGEKFVNIFSDLTEDQWSLEVYTEGTIWSIRNILSHFHTSERGLVKMFQSIVQGGVGAPDDFSIDLYNASQQEKSKELTVPELLEKYKSTRAETIAWVSGLKETDLELIGRHPFLEMTTIREMIKMLYIHNQVHYRDMKKILK